MNDGLQWYWVSTIKFTAGFAVDEQGIVKKAAPILKRWLGQDKELLISAYKKYPGTMVKCLDNKVTATPS